MVKVFTLKNPSSISSLPVTKSGAAIRYMWSASRNVRPQLWPVICESGCCEACTCWVSDGMSACYFERCC